MYQQLISYLDKIAFFHTSAFGILSLVFVGASWCLVGAIAGKAPKKNIKMEHLLFIGGILAMAVCAVFMFLSGNIAKDTPPVALILTMIAYFFAGVTCFIQHLGTSRAMQYGPNGVIWTLTQSAMVFPFIVSIIFYDVKLTAMRLAGIILLLLSLAVFGGAKNDPETSKGPWKIVTLIVLIAVIIDQIILSIPFYYKETAGISNCLCILVAMFGYVVPAFFKILSNKKDGSFADLKKAVCRRDVWIYSVLLLPVAAFIAFTLQIPGMRAMASNGIGGMSFPLLVGSCISAFSIYSMIVLKERMKALELAALALCIAGLICLCIV